MCGVGILDGQNHRPRTAVSFRGDVIITALPRSGTKVVGCLLLQIDHNAALEEVYASIQWLLRPTVLHPEASSATEPTVVPTDADSFVDSGLAQLSLVTRTASNDLATYCHRTASTTAGNVL
jgi:hypothetical protein